ncbi:DoxX family protein [Chitinophaga niabensis]|uniref:DoxX-like family protein n=1 Tax=Chitinophaga niabensis TaxID=536979 RepID=A0A1N6F8F8_9BACT|nr:DoxX family protein [Chitinophaga niabensis]SIN91572.1 DoxX-like family protein [Chitinophaga niabensis]
MKKNTLLWIAQSLVAGTLAWAAYMKLFQPVSDLWPWAKEVPLALVRLTGVVDLLGAAGLILPSLLDIRPKLTPIAAIGVVMLMICAAVFHIIRGEASVIGMNIVFAIIATFIAWGRLKPIRNETHTTT